jgi:hypothetical protein
LELELIEEDKIYEEEAKLEDEKERKRESYVYSEKEQVIATKIFDDKCDRYNIDNEPKENLEFDMYGTKPYSEAIYTDRLMTFEYFHEFGL